MTDIAKRRELAQEWDRVLASAKDVGLGEPSMVPFPLGWRVQIGDHVLGSDPEPADAIHHALVYLSGYRAHKHLVTQQYEKAKSLAAKDTAFEGGDFYGNLIKAHKLLGEVRISDGLGGPVDHVLLAQAVDLIVASMLCMPKPNKRSAAEKSEIFRRIYSP